MTNDDDLRSGRRLIATVLPPREGFSPGAVGAIGLLARRLALAGDEFRTVVLGGVTSVPPFSDVPFVAVRPATLGGRPLNRLYAFMAARILRRLKPTVIEVHNRAEIALALARRLPSIPVLLFLHNDPQAAHGARTPRERRTLLERLAGVVVISEWMRARFLEGIPAPPREPVLLHNCIDLTDLPPPCPDDSREQQILFAGRLVHNKGADTFVAACGRALAALPGWRATAIGADGFSADSRETDFLRDLRVAARQAGVELAGYRDHAETMAAMARAAIIVVPSRWQEPFGLVALEALANGAALVCSHRGALPEVAGEAAVYVDPEDVGGLGHAIVALARDPARRAALGTLGRARARQFGVREAARVLDALRRGVIEASSY